MDFDDFDDFVLDPFDEDNGSFMPDLSDDDDDGLMPEDITGDIFMPNIPTKFLSTLLSTQAVLPQQSPIDKYLHKNPKEKDNCVQNEKELQAIILQAAENGYIDTLRKAIPVLRQVQKTLHLTATGLNFCEGRGSETTRSKQVYTFNKIV